MLESVRFTAIRLLLPLRKNEKCFWCLQINFETDARKWSDNNCVSLPGVLYLVPVCVVQRAAQEISRGLNANIFHRKKPKKEGGHNTVWILQTDRKQQPVALVVQKKIITRKIV